jgi:dTDP-4-amino-4,6-dideoxygalactose transaminase
VVRVPNRDAVQKKMADEGVPTEIYYPFTIPEQKVLRPYCSEKGWTESEVASRSVLALPIFPELKKEEQQMVIAALKKALS